MSRPLLVVLLLGVAGCATSSSFRSGERAERRADFDTAVVEYGKAVKADPDKFDYRTALSRARLRASAEHQAAGRRLLIRGHGNERPLAWHADHVIAVIQRAQVDAMERQLRRKVGDRHLGTQHEHLQTALHRSSNRFRQHQAICVCWPTVWKAAIAAASRISASA